MCYYRAMDLSRALEKGKQEENMLIIMTTRVPTTALYGLKMLLVSKFLVAKVSKGRRRKKRSRRRRKRTMWGGGEKEEEVNRGRARKGEEKKEETNFPNFCIRKRESISISQR